MYLPPFADIPKWNHVNVSNLMIVDQCTYSHDGIDRMVNRFGGIELTQNSVSNNLTRVLQDHNTLTSEAATNDQKNAFYQWIAYKGEFANHDASMVFRDTDPAFVHRTSSTLYAYLYGAKQVSSFMQKYGYGETVWTYCQKLASYWWLDFIEGKLRPLTLKMDFLYGDILDKEQENLKICCYSGMRSPQPQSPFVPEKRLHLREILRKQNLDVVLDLSPAEKDLFVGV